MPTALLIGGFVVAGDTVTRADVRLQDGVIAAIGNLQATTADTVVDCAGRLIMPGFIDTHSHVDGIIFDAAVQEALLAQGVTTVIGGQDGVSFAPGDGTFASEYFAAINGSHPTFAGGSVADLLATYDGATPLNVAYAVPAGTIRAAVCERRTEPADADEIAANQKTEHDGSGTRGAEPRERNQGSGTRAMFEAQAIRHWPAVRGSSAGADC